MAALSTSGLKKEFWAKREIDPVFPCHGGEVMILMTIGVSSLV